MILQPSMYQPQLDTIVGRLNTVQAPLSVLEWGCGHSTVYLSEWLRPASWLSIEPVREWADNVRPLVGPQVIVHCTNVRGLPADEGSRQDALKALSPDQADVMVVAAGVAKAWRFNVAIVDGRHRAACCRLAAEYCDPGGYICLHDAQREYYPRSLPGCEIVHDSMTLGVGLRIWQVHP